MMFNRNDERVRIAYSVSERYVRMVPNMYRDDVRVSAVTAAFGAWDAWDGRGTQKQYTGHLAHRAALNIARELLPKTRGGTVRVDHPENAARISGGATPTAETVPEEWVPGNLDIDTTLMDIESVLGKVSAKNEKLLRMRHLDGRILDDIGEEMNLTGPRINQLLKKACAEANAIFTYGVT